MKTKNQSGTARKIIIAVLVLCIVLLAAVIFRDQIRVWLEEAFREIAYDEVVPFVD